MTEHFTYYTVRPHDPSGTTLADITESMPTSQGDTSDLAGRVTVIVPSTLSLDEISVALYSLLHYIVNPEAGA